LQRRSWHRAQDRLAVKKDEHGSVCGPKNRWWGVFKAVRALARSGLSESKRSNQVIQRYRTRSCGHDIPQNGKRVAPAISGVRKASFEDFKPLEHDGPFGPVNSALRLEPHNSNLAGLLGGFDFDSSARCKRVTCQPFNLRLVNCYGVAVGGSNPGPGSFLIESCLERRARQAKHTRPKAAQKYESYFHSSSARERLAVGGD
jgi:hypothetical protein